MVASCTSLLFLLLVVSCREAYGYNPKPNGKSVVEVGAARFTVLTERLVRMEWGGANDNATFAFLNRDLPTPTYNVSKDGGATVIQTPYVKVKQFVFKGEWLVARGSNDIIYTTRSATYQLIRRSQQPICKSVSSSTARQSPGAPSQPGTGLSMAIY